jgi:hypothetical protein
VDTEEMADGDEDEGSNEDMDDDPES